jgi:cell division transport system permease protein
MAQFGKSSSKRGKPTYTGAIIGVALVLFLFGFIGGLFLNVRKTGDYLKENIEVHAYTYPEASKKRIDSLTKYVAALPFTRDVRFVNKEMAAKIWNAQNDSTWSKMLENNPLPESVDFFIKANYVQKDSLNNLSANLQTAFPNVISEFQFPTETVTTISKWVKIVALICLIAGLVLTILVVFAIDNTIRLAMYSNRFIIKTMQMVGATRWFIAKPVNVRAIINGIIASAIAIVAIWLAMWAIELYVPGFKNLRDTKNMIFLFLFIMFLGVSITLISTHRSVIKYLRMKLDDLY